MFFTAIIWFFLFCNGKAYIVNCSITECQKSFINCPPRENCFVACTDRHSCINSVVNCPVTGDCHIKCYGSESCQNVLIDATLLSGDLNVLCKGDSNSTDQCKGMQIYGNTLQSNHGTFNVECSDSRSCIHSDLSCPLNGDCNLWCTGSASCQYAVITGPMQRDLNIDCDAERACFGATVNGAQSSALTVTGCTQLKSCLDLTLHCPPHSNGVKQCFIEGNDNLGGDISSASPTVYPTQNPTLHPTVYTNNPTTDHTTEGTAGIVIYAMNGWKDIAINYTGTFGVTHDGMMICGSNYDSVCNLAKHDWSCEDSNMYCDDDSHTPSVFPTQVPVRIPTMVSKVPTAVDTVQQMDHKATTKSATSISAVQHGGYSSNMTGDVFILSGIGVMIGTCLCVGCAKFRKSIADAHKAKHDSQCGASVPSSLEYTSRHSSSRKHSISRTRSHPSSARRSIYDEVDHAHDHEVLC